MKDNEFSYSVSVYSVAFKHRKERLEWLKREIGYGNFLIYRRERDDELRIVVLYKFKYEKDVVLFALKWA